tara:strand:+ start:300 stop:521 length:222 start_codon:yes stop_codon:yes gene_type:complete
MVLLLRLDEICVGYTKQRGHVHRCELECSLVDSLRFRELTKLVEDTAQPAFHANGRVARRRRFAHVETGRRRL